MADDRELARTRRELEIRRRGFTLLARLGGTLGAHVELKPALAAALPVIESGLQVQRTLALERSGDAYVPFAWTGYQGAEAERIAGARLRLPAAEVEQGILITRDSDAAWVAGAREALGIPMFVAVGAADGEVVLVAGREAETDDFCLRLDPADIDTLGAVGDLVAASVQNTQVAALAQIRRFLPPAVADGVMSGRMLADQGYTRREVTLLVVDMVGFTVLADSVEPDVLAGLLNRYLGEMTTLAHAHGGTVGSLAGDGVLVMFGAPEACSAEEHAWAAAQCAFAMRARLSLVADDDQTPVSVRIGVNTGACAVGVFGSASQATYTAIGLPVNLATRLETAAAPGMILVSGPTRDLLGGRVHAASRGELSLKGFSRPVPAHVVEPA